MPKEQFKGGILEIPEDWFVTSANFDSKPPTIVITQNYPGNGEKTLEVPESLAYYLRVHWCGSQIMHDRICEKARHVLQNKIKDLLDL